MARPGKPGRFKPSQPAPRAIAVDKIMGAGNYRGSPRSRGYDSRWDRISVAFRKQRPFCLFCQQQGRDTLADLVDHILPVIDRPDLKYEWHNLAQLCTACHGKKARLEHEARVIGDINLLKKWVSDPNLRPSHLMPICL